MSNYSSAARDLRGKAAETYDKAKLKVVETSREAAYKVDQHAKKNPWWYVGVGAAAASFFGYFIGRNTKK